MSEVAKEEGVAEFSVLDWSGVVMAGVVGLGECAFPFVVAPAFAAMFADFGGELPAATRLVLTPWFAPLLGLVCFLLLGVAVGRRSRVLAVGAFLLASVSMVGCLVALYLPIFELAGNIR